MPDDKIDVENVNTHVAVHPMDVGLMQLLPNNFE